jgi:cytochrome c oxidase cbb3-type subunit 2
MFDVHHDERWLFAVIWGAFAILTLLIAIGPALRSQSSQEPLPASEPMTDLERRGLTVYVDEGCAYCHTQQVRPVKMDQSLGRPSVAGDYARLDRPGPWRQTPAVLGSERTGPDLTNVGKRQPSQQWHYMHLYNPRAVVEASVMPAFPWLFRTVEDPPNDATVVSMPEGYGPKEGKVIPNERGKALVAYLTSLKQAPLPEGRASSPDGSASTGDDSKQQKGETQATGDRGASLYGSHCSSCHQPDGTGLPGTFPPLKDDPVVTADDPTRHVEIILEGMQGKKIEGTAYSAAMPSFADALSNDEIAAIVNHERTSWGNDAPMIDPERVAEIRKMVTDD